MKKLIYMLAGVRRHKVTYLGVGFMSNTYRIATIEFISTRRERREFKTIADIGVYKNYKALTKHLNPVNGVYKYKSIIH